MKSQGGSRETQATAAQPDTAIAASRASPLLPPEGRFAESTDNSRKA